MATFDQELTGRYAAAGADHADLDARRVARAAFVRDTSARSMTPTSSSESTGPISAHSPSSSTPPKKHLEHISHDVNQRSVMAPPTTGGDTA